MKIESLEITDYPPIKNFKIENLGDIVIIAGANGSGKTRLKEALVASLQGNPLMSIKVRETRDEEKTWFGGEIIVAQQGQPNQILNNYMGSRSFGRGRYVGSLVQIDSQRNIQTTSYNQISYQVADPDDQEIPANYYYKNFTSRWQDFMNYIHQKVASHRNSLAEAVEKDPSQTGENILQQNPHPLEKYKEIFARLLPGKELQDVNPVTPGQFQYRDANDQVLPFSLLSSGEQEVVKVIFDIARKDIRHSVIIVDEPELHLHPALAFKLIETLKTVGENTNQFIFLTHSADLISTYYSTGNVYFIDAEQTGSNQAHQLSQLNHSHNELVQLIGENLGLFAVGKKLVFVEGEYSSIDRLTYHAIAQKFLPEVKIFPVGSVVNVTTLNAFEQQIRKSIFGIDLYMIRDRDGLSQDQIDVIENSGRIKCLKKRHIENYFLDAEVLFRVADKLYLTTTNTNLSQQFIETKLEEIAKKSLSYNLLQNTKEFLETNHFFKIPTVKDLDKKNLDEIKTAIVSGVKESLAELSDALTETMLNTWLDEEKGKLEAALTNGTWIDEFHGKFIFSKICRIMGDSPIRIRQAYVDIALEEKAEVFDEIKVIFESFRT